MVGAHGRRCHPSATVAPRSPTGSTRPEVTCPSPANSHKARCPSAIRVGARLERLAFMFCLFGFLVWTWVTILMLLCGAVVFFAGFIALVPFVCLYCVNARFAFSFNKLRSAVFVPSTGFQPRARTLTHPPSSQSQQRLTLIPPAPQRTESICATPHFFFFLFSKYLVTAVVWAGPFFNVFEMLLNRHGCYCALPQT